MLHIGYTEEKQLYYIWYKERIRIICVSLSRKVKSRQGEGGRCWPMRSGKTPIFSFSLSLSLSLSLSRSLFLSVLVYLYLFVYHALLSIPFHLSQFLVNWHFSSCTYQCVSFFSVWFSFTFLFITFDHAGCLSNQRLF